MHPPSSIIPGAVSSLAKKIWQRHLQVVTLVAIDVMIHATIPPALLTVTRSPLVRLYTSHIYLVLSDRAFCGLFVS